MFSAIELITRAGRTPHGYTLTIWAAGMFCVSGHGLPSTGEVWAFTLAATASFGVVRCIGIRRHADSAIAVPVHGPVTSMHLLALPGAMAVSWALAMVCTPWCWPASSAGATFAFLVLHGGQDAVRRRLRARVAQPEAYD